MGGGLGHVFPCCHCPVVDTLMEYGWRVISDKMSYDSGGGVGEYLERPGYYRRRRLRGKQQCLQLSHSRSMARGSSGASRMLFLKHEAGLNAARIARTASCQHTQ